ncbi:MAG: ribosomal L7Ae/L30e/S12e/Gadd45 family protein [Lachnospiraceae bacterium]|nr:ribosomal L7Ae/L30e/S12e/Gadd45 family protein [Lachnospiraceae bacterium]
MNNDKVLNLIGLAQKAGKVVSGEFMTEKAVKSGGAALVVLAEDASDNTKKKFGNMCEFYEVPLRVHAVKDYLGHAMGKELRASLAVTDEGLAQAIMKKMD